jgi:hypothetical protein
MLSEGLQIAISDFEVENLMLTGDYLQQVVEIVIGGVPTILKVHFMCLFMSQGIILMQGSGLTNLFDPMSHQVDLQNVEDGIELRGNINLVADIIPPRVHFVLLLGQRPIFSIYLLVNLSFHQEFRPQGIGFGLRLLSACPSKKTSFTVCKQRQGSSVLVNVSSS